MNPHDCIIRNDLIAKRDTPRLWPSIIVADEIKERLFNHALLALTLRRDLDFVATSLHGLILMYGPPGTGKTTLARGLPIELLPVVGDVRLIELNPHGLMSAEHGQSQQQVARLLEEVVPQCAEDGKPTVVVIDEVESMAVARAEASLGANPVDVHRATDAVLTALDRSADRHPNIIWIATSNFTGALDDAFKSRADAAIEVPLPGVDGVRHILRDALTQISACYPQVKTLVENPKLAQVAKAAQGVDGRRARKLVIEALARRRATAADPNQLTIDDLLDAARALTEMD